MIVENRCFDEERALYGLHDAKVAGCTFAGPADGESALKECSGIEVENCLFGLRYPLWHVRNGAVRHCRMTEDCRAALWYDNGIRLEDCDMDGIKAVRECQEAELACCRIHSPEFGWQCRSLRMEDCELAGEYAFLHSTGLDIRHLKLEGKYSFQYVQDARIDRCILHTKDAFWHSRNVTVTDSVVSGEYLGWYSENLHLIRCRIIGTQPLCYARGLVLTDCEMEGTDLAFENSEVEALVKGRIDSVKNPAAGWITAGSIGEIILDEHVWPGAGCRIEETERRRG